MVVLIGLIAEPMQRRSGKSRLDYLEKRLNVGKQLLDLGTAHAFDSKDTGKVKRELKTLYRQYQVTTRERALRAKRDRDVLYWNMYNLIPPRPRTVGATLLIIWLLYIPTVFVFYIFFPLVIARQPELDLSLQQQGFRLLTLFFMALIMITAFCSTMGSLVVDAQKYVMDKRKMRVPSLTARPWPVGAWRDLYMLVLCVAALKALSVLYFFIFRSDYKILQALEGRMIRRAEEKRSLFRSLGEVEVKSLRERAYMQ